MPVFSGFFIQTFAQILRGRGEGAGGLGVGGWGGGREDSGTVEDSEKLTIVLDEMVETG